MRRRKSTFSPEVRLAQRATVFAGLSDDERREKIHMAAYRCQQYAWARRFWRECRGKEFVPGKSEVDSKCRAIQVINAA